MNVRTQQATFQYKRDAAAKGATVNGTFMTEVFFTAYTGGKKLLYSQSALRTYDTNWGWHMSNGTCGGKKIAAIPHHKVSCGEFSASTDLSSTTFNYQSWKIVIETHRVFGHLFGTPKRLDIKIKGPRNYDSHGLIGQSFRRDYAYKGVAGATDAYPASGNFTARAQAQGVIEGTHLTYAMYGPYDTGFQFSAFDLNAKVDDLDLGEDMEAMAFDPNDDGISE
jgi:hypothetical protein